MTAFSITAPSPAAFTESVAASVTASITIQNAASGAHDNIFVVTHPTVNFAFTVQFSDVDMNANPDTLGLGTQAVTLATPSDASKKLDTSASETFTGTVGVTVAASTCPQVGVSPTQSTTASGHKFGDRGYDDAVNGDLHDL